MVKTKRNKGKKESQLNKTYKKKITEYYDKQLVSKVKDIETTTVITQRLFSKINIQKIKDLPYDLVKNVDAYTELVSSEFKALKKGIASAPNENYYDYVNNSWIETQTKKLEKLPTYYVQVDNFRIVQDKVYEEVLSYTDEYIRENKTTKKGKALSAIRYCIQNANNNKGLLHCKRVYDDITNYIDDDNMYGLLAYCNSNEIVSWQTPIVWSILPDEKDVKRYRSHISPPQLGVYDYFIYIDEPTDSPKEKLFKKTFKENYFKFINKTFKLILPDNKEFSAQDIWDVELELLNAIGCNKIKKEDPNYYNILTKKEMEDDYGFNWTYFMNEFKVTGRDVPNKIIVSSLNALKCTTELMKKNWTSKSWKAYWLFMHYKQMIRFSYDWSAIYYEFYGKFVSGQPIHYPSNIYSMYALANTFNTFLSQEYAKRHHDPLLQLYIKNMVEDLRYIFMKKIERNNWLSPSTKKSALLKLEKLEIQIGVPPNLREDPLLDYIDDDPWHNMKLLADWRLKEFIKIDGTTKQVDIPEIDWNMFKLVGTQTYMVNAYYRPTSNSIYVPLAYIQKPFIDLGQRGIEYNLAFIGYTLGHELSHSLDDMGSKFDADGNMNNWWTDKDKKIFKIKLKDIIDQYDSAAKKDNIKIDPELGVGENLADIVGLSLVEEYLFYFQLIHDDIPKIKNLSLEAFYVYTAIQSRQKIFDAARPKQLKTNPHSLDKYRCNCPLARLKLFREIYHVKKGDGMYWHNTDTIW
jgi:putative endopeptidase